MLSLLIGLAVAAVLASVAYPSYQSQLASSRRLDARQALVALAQRLERHHIERDTYAGASVGTAGLFTAASHGGYYTLAIVRQTADEFLITATPLGRQASDACATFTYNHLGEKGVEGGASLPATTCW